MPNTRLQFGSFILHGAHRRLLKHTPEGEITVRLAGAEVAILQHLLSHPDTLCAKETLTELGWQGRPVSANALPVAIANLRKQLTTEPPQIEIRNIPRQGYLLALSVPLMEMEEPAAVPLSPVTQEEPPVEEGPLSEVSTALDPSQAQTSKQSKRLWPSLMIGLKAINLLLLGFLILLGPLIYKEWIDVRCAKDEQGETCVVDNSELRQAEWPARHQGQLLLVSGRHWLIVDRVEVASP
ncbi:transcriptional regulator [Aeromonas bivalvium]|uniref:Transcriptional regulator n=1 Tax=Aeromonas bivalvium TaxID=440079 RepID=A0ABW9GUL8_9GAMM